MFELILWGISRIYEEVKDSIGRSGEIYEEIGGESAESLINLLGLSNTQQIVAPYEDFPCIN